MPSPDAEVAIEGLRAPLCARCIFVISHRLTVLEYDASIGFHGGGALGYLIIATVVRGWPEAWLRKHCRRAWVESLAFVCCTESDWMVLVVFFDLGPIMLCCGLFVLCDEWDTP